MLSLAVTRALLLAAIFGTGAWVMAQDAAPVLVRIVHISFLAHRAQVSRLTDSPVIWAPALLNAPVTQGEAIKTMKRGEIEVQLECGSALRLAPNSEFTFPQLSRHADDGIAATTVAVRSGSAFFSLRHRDSRDFQVTLPGGAVIAPDGSAKFRVDIAAGQPAALQVSDGDVIFHLDGKDVKVKKSKRLVWAPGRAPKLEKPAPTDQWDQWSKSRDAAFGRSMMALALRHLSPFDAAAPSLTPPTAFAGALQPAAPGFAADGIASALAGPPPPPLNPTIPVPACARY